MEGGIYYQISIQEVNEIFLCSVMWYYYGSANTFSAYFLICCFHSVRVLATRSFIHSLQLSDAVFFFEVLHHTKINNSCTFDVPWPFPYFWLDF